jgi:predicted GIY-YIG superfamily endonuclease
VKRCALYRHFDEDDVLLYVGISDNPTRRGTQHASGSEWAKFAMRATVEWLPCRSAAEAAELEIIETEGPVYNRAGATGDVEARIAHYLEQRGKRHLHRRAPEELLTLREAVRRKVVPYRLAVCLHARLQGERFPEHAGWSWGRRLYSDESLREWVDSLNFGAFALHPVFTRSELRSVRQYRRRLARRRTRGTRGEDNL